MAQNRNKLIDLFVGNITNAVVHKILEEAVEDEAIRKYYDKELLNSLKAAKIYRERINPVKEPLPEKDATDIKSKVMSRAANELKLRISKGYNNINIDSVEEITKNVLIGMGIMSG